MSVVIRGSDNLDTNNGAKSTRCIQIINKLISTQSLTTTIGQYTDKRIAADYFLDIVPKGRNSRFKIQLRWTGEIIDRADTVFNIHRNGARINNGAEVEGNGFGLGTATGTYNRADNASTPEYAYILAFDEGFESEPGVPIHYEMMFSSNIAYDVRNNRCFANVVSGYEIGVSEIIITEYSN